jgi:hypothetical protein
LLKDGIVKAVAAAMKVTLLSVLGVRKFVSSSFYLQKKYRHLVSTALVIKIRTTADEMASRTKIL